MKEKTTQEEPMLRAREEGARVQGAVLSAFATTETNEQMKVRMVVPPEVPHDRRICMEDLVDMEIDQLRDDEKKGKQPGNGTPEHVSDESEYSATRPTMEETKRSIPSPKQVRESTFHALSSSNLSSQCWAKCTQPRTARFSTRRNFSGKRKMKSELSEAERTPLADQESATKFTGSCTRQAYTDDVDGKLRAELATSIREADSKRDEWHGALKSALGTQDCRLGKVVGRLGNEQEAQHKEVLQVLQSQKEAFDARLTQELEHVTCESSAKPDKNHEHVSRMQESLETRIRDEQLRIESENGAKERAEAKPRPTRPPLCRDKLQSTGMHERKPKLVKLLGPRRPWKQLSGPRLLSKKRERPRRNWQPRPLGERKAAEALGKQKEIADAQAKQLSQVQWASRSDAG